jgi:hypothetical protein
MADSSTYFFDRKKREGKVGEQEYQKSNLVCVVYILESVLPGNGDAQGRISACSCNGYQVIDKSLHAAIKAIDVSFLPASSCMREPLR